jgi:hypothetical protein
MKSSKRIFLMPDTHFAPEGEKNGGHDELALRTALKAIEVVRPDELIHIGDIGEWESVSPWQYKRQRRPPLQYTLNALDQDIFAVNQQLDRIDAVCKKAGVRKKTLLEGNHELWVTEMVSEMDLAADHYQLPKQLRLRQRGWAWHEYGKYVKRGRLRLYHGGHYATIHHAYNHAVKLGASVAYGHTHDVQYVTVPSADGPHLGVSLGCLCKLQKGFLKGRSTNWQHAFGVLYLQPNGDFNVEVHRIEKGWATVMGREIKDGRLLAGRPRKGTDE